MDVVRSTQGSCIFIVFDTKRHVFCFGNEKLNKKKTAFKFDDRVYEWNLMVKDTNTVSKPCSLF